MSGGFLQRGGLWVAAQAILMLAVALLGVTGRGAFDFDFRLLAAVLLLLLSALTGLAGVAVLGRNRTPYPRPRDGAQLIQTGIYQFLRHPLYTSVICWAASWALFWSSRSALAASLILALFFDAKARAEERWLRAQYPHYTAYERKVRRFIPFIYSMMLFVPFPL